MVEPITETQKEEVIAETARYIHRASSLFGRHFEEIPVIFDLKGRSAGMYKVKARNGDTQQKMIRYNPYIFSKYYEENFSSTIPHEVAHYITHILYSSKRVSPHGDEWRDVMLKFGVEPRRTGQWNLDGIPQRLYKKYEYSCACRSHQLTSRRHLKIQRDKARYLCRYCGDLLQVVTI